MPAKTNFPGFGPEFLLIPGPTPLPDRVRRAMAQQSIDFSGSEFVEIADRLFENLKPLFGTSDEVFLYAANGHGGWEAALANTVSPGETVLLPETGLFSEAWREMTKALGINNESLPSNWRNGIDANLLRQRLDDDKDHRIKAVLIVHTDTASGVTSDIDAIAAAIKDTDHPALLMVDTIASLCTTPFHMQNMAVDVTVSASQKALMGPPGLALVGVNQRALEMSKSVTMPRHYWCWQERMRGEHYKRFCGTAPEQLVFALSEAVAMINEQGLENTVQRHERLATMVRATVERWCDGGSMEFNAVNAHERANSVTTVRTPDGFDAEQIRVHLHNNHNVVIGGGLGELRGSIFRIGHMGYINLPYIGGTLMAIDSTLHALGVAVGDGAVECGLTAFNDSIA